VRVEEAATLGLFLIEQAAVDLGFQFVGFRGEARFELCGELIVEDVVFVELVRGFRLLLYSI
jgi:hypothetical protein